MVRSSGNVIGCRRDQLSPPQMYKRSVGGAFGEPGCVRDRPHTGTNGTPFISCGLAVKMQVNHKRGGLLIVPDQITHQHIQHVNVDGNAVFEFEI